LFFFHNSTIDFLIIRPSGNPIERFIQMISGDIVQEKTEITKIHRLESLSENIIMCILTLVRNLLIKGNLIMTYQEFHQFLTK